MKKSLRNFISVSILIIWLLLSLSSSAQSEPQPYGALPSERQLRWQETEMYCLIHYGLATYTDKEWGFGDERPSDFTAGNFSAADLVSTAKAGGFKGIVVVAKHHDGFCLWPTATTQHNITRSPWKNGKGDMVKEYSEACKAAGMKMGVYCSPWDRNNALYGSSAYVEDVYRKQLKELYANYGTLFMSWHDGANGGDGFYGGAREKRKIDPSTYYEWDTTWAITRKMQPRASLFGDVGPDVRWVGNEEGHAGETSWATFEPKPLVPGTKPANGFANSDEGIQGTRNGKFWIPAECDVSLRPGWFYHASQNEQVKSPQTLLDLYFQSVGRGACLDLGLSPNKEGRLESYDSSVLVSFGKLLKSIFSNNLLAGAKLKASNVRKGNESPYKPELLIDNDRYSYWATDDSVHTPELEIILPEQRTFNIIRLRENIKLGQRIEAVAIDAWVNSQWKEIGAATSIGANRLIRLVKPLTAGRLRLRVVASPVCVALSDLGLFLEPEHLPTPVVSTNGKGLVTIKGEADGSQLHYTINGSVPDTSGKVYSSGISLPQGGVVRAIQIGSNGSRSDLAVKTIGLSSAKWQLVGAGSSSDFKLAHDGDERTVWEAPINKMTRSPANIVIDIVKPQLIRQLSYQRGVSKSNAGIVARYRVELSETGKDWQQVSEGEFSNIASSSADQVIVFARPYRARYLRFTALSLIAGKQMRIGEISFR